MQGTIKDFDAESRTGSVLTDDRTEIAIEPASLAQDVLSLRLGQRVRFEVEAQGDARVARDLRLVTFE
ncbi:MAG: hypothetical protein ACM3OO_05600 [Planctomycetaceae bacterium]